MGQTIWLTNRVLVSRIFLKELVIQSGPLSKWLNQRRGGNIRLMLEYASI